VAGRRSRSRGIATDKRSTATFDDSEDLDIRSSIATLRIQQHQGELMAKSASVEISKALIRKRALEFASRWAGTTSESAEKQTFWNEFFAIFGIDRRQVAAFEQIAKRASTGGQGSSTCSIPARWPSSISPPRRTWTWRWSKRSITCRRLERV
jgi:hypothetical protein